jgi:hypothetical protein
MPSSDISLPSIAGETTRAREPVRQLSVFLQNRVGALLALVKLLNEHDIEVLGLSVQDHLELTMARLVVTDPDQAMTVFEAAGHACASRPIVVVEFKEGVHDFAQALSALLAAEINIHHVYPLMVRPNDKPLLALYVDDYEIGGESLSKCGFKVLTQGELSR